VNRSTLPALLTGTAILGIALVISARPEDVSHPAPTAEALPRAVRTDVVTLTDAGRTVRLAGVTRAADRASLAFTLPARVASRPVDVGDRVVAGQLVARLDDREYRLAEASAAASLAELDVRLEQARRDRDRAARLVAARAGTLEELEQLEAAATALQAARSAAAVRLDESRRRLGETRLEAPFDGTVTEVGLEPGEWASPGRMVVALSGTGPVELRVEAPESVRGSIVRGATVAVELPLVGGRSGGRVASVAAAATGAGGLFPVVVELDPGPDVVAGLAAEVTLPLDAPPRLSVPLAAVLDRGSSRPAVLRVAGGRVERVEVVPDQVIGDRVALRPSALSEGDRVAVAGHTSLVDGDAVEVF